MNKDGPGKQSISERLKVRLEQDTRELEDATRSELMRLAGNLATSSSAALRQTGENIRAQSQEIEDQVSASRNRILSALAEIEVKPQRTLRQTMIVSAMTGAAVATIPWAVMTYLNQNAFSATLTNMAERSALTAEIAPLEAKLTRLAQSWVETGEEGTFVVLPNAEKILHKCGSQGFTCIRLRD